ncbi:CDP-glycerol glycerophosphotransferase family protein [Fictibacillus enclensis]|nr:CDP-glycerol glycerophosphotransferase family protein [Fictibacillus enclensis]
MIKDFYAYLIPRYFIFFYDLEKYRDTLRGFYINLEEEVPGPLLRDSEDVFRTIENIDEVKEQYTMNFFMKNFADGKKEMQPNRL